MRGVVDVGAALRDAAVVGVRPLRRRGGVGRRVLVRVVVGDLRAGEHVARGRVGGFAIVARVGQELLVVVVGDARADVRRGRVRRALQVHLPRERALVAGVVVRRVVVRHHVREQLVRHALADGDRARVQRPAHGAVHRLARVAERHVLEADMLVEPVVPVEPRALRAARTGARTAR